MNREIKFRAWIGKMEQMSDEVTVKWDGSFSAVIGGINGYSTADGGVLMQYTGLKDKNGKEIYEGDIISFDDARDVVEWDESAGAWGARDCNPPLDRPHYWNDYKVIGNVFENKELLTN